MKKLLSIILAVSMILSVSSVPAFADQAPMTKDFITITVDGEYIDCAAYGQLPVAINGTTLVPLRSVFEALGADVKWDDETKSVVSFRDDVSILLQLNSTQMIVNGEVKTLSVPAQSMNNRIMVPVRAISEAFGCDVKWDGDTRCVVIRTDIPSETPQETPEKTPEEVLENTPEEAVKKAFEAILDLDYEEAEKYCVDPYVTFGDLIGPFWHLVNSEEMTEEEAQLVFEYVLKMCDMITVETNDAVINGDTSIVNVTISTPDFNSVNTDEYLTDESLLLMYAQVVESFGYTIDEYLLMDDPYLDEKIERVYMDTLMIYIFEAMLQESKNVDVIVETAIILLEKIDGKWMIV